MDPMFVLLLGMIVVIVSVLWLRLHAFLGLLAGAIVVAMLTPNQGIYFRAVRDRAIPIEQIDASGIATFKDTSELVVPSPFVIVQLDTDQTAVTQRGIVVIESAADTTSGWHLRPQAGNAEQAGVLPSAGEYLIHPWDLEVAEQEASATWPTRIAEGFGSTCGKIGIVIAMAAIIGQCLLDSGAAERIVTGVRHGFGDRNTPLAFAISGFVIGIPVYFDTVFYLLLPLARALTQRTGRDYLLYILSIIVGATMAHSLVPPTPGPLLVAAELDVGLGTMILAGSAVGLISVSAGFGYALWANRRWRVALPTGLHEASSVTASLDGRDRRQPPIWLACLPIALPVLLLSVGTVLQLDWGREPTANEPAASSEVWLDVARSVWTILGDKHVALGLATVIGLLTLVAYPPATANPLRSVNEAVLNAGNIVLITAAGGAFGTVLRQSGIADSIQERFPIESNSLSLLIAAFLITAVIRIAQGSATVAMITAVGIMAPLVQSIELAFHPVYVALAIGCGSKPIPWMNDSGFWVITRMSGMTESESLRTFSVALTLMGIVGLAVTLAGATWLPLTR